MASEAGKGDGQRPTDMNKYRTNYDSIFGKKPTPKNNVEVFIEEAKILNEEGKKIIMKALIDENNLKIIGKEIK